MGRRLIKAFDESTEPVGTVCVCQFCIHTLYSKREIIKIAHDEISRYLVLFDLVEHGKRLRFNGFLLRTHFSFARNACALRNIVQ